MWNHTPTVSQHTSHYHMDLRTAAGMARERPGEVDQRMARRWAPDDNLREAR